MNPGAWTANQPSTPVQTQTAAPAGNASVYRPANQPAQPAQPLQPLQPSASAQQVNPGYAANLGGYQPIPFEQERDAAAAEPEQKPKKSKRALFTVLGIVLGVLVIAGVLLCIPAVRDAIFGTGDGPHGIYYSETLSVAAEFSGSKYKGSFLLTGSESTGTWTIKDNEVTVDTAGGGQEKFTYDKEKDELLWFGQTKFVKISQAELDEFKKQTGDLQSAANALTDLFG